jgi:ankyrin repeat protein
VSWPTYWKKGADVKPIGDQNPQVIALMTTCYQGYKHVIKNLLLHEANIEATSHQGETLLYYATPSGQMSIMKILINAGTAMFDILINAGTAMYEKT